MVQAAGKIGNKAARFPRATGRHYPNRALTLRVSLLISALRQTGPFCIRQID
jgi:hypothetical protein